MPTLEQLPQVAAANASDLVLLDQSGDACVVSVEALLKPAQPKLTLASGVLLGRASLGPGGPEPIGVGHPLTIQGGTLVLDADGLAPLDSPAFVGKPQAPTQVSTDVSNALATTAYVQAILLDKATVTLGARLPGIDGSAVQVTRSGGVPIALSDAFSERWDVRAFGARGDGVRLSGAATIAYGSSTLQVAGAAFASADIGKLIAVNGAGPQGATLATTIASVSSGTVVGLSAVASTALNGRPHAVCYGSDDAAAIAAALASAAVSGGEVVFPAAIHALGSALILPETGSLRLAGAGPGATQLVALRAIAGGLVSKGKQLHRNSQIVDLRLDANALAAYALDLQCAEDYRIDRAILSNGTIAGLRVGDGISTAREIHVAHSRIDNDGYVFGLPTLLPPYNILVNGVDCHFNNLALANAAIANLRDAADGNNSYTASRASGYSSVAGTWNAQYGYWINGAASILGCDVDGVSAAATAYSVGGVNGAGIRVDGWNVRVIGSSVHNLLGGAVGILLTADQTGNAPGNCYIAGNQVDMGTGGVLDATRAVVQLGFPRSSTIIADNPGAALRQSTGGVVSSGVRAVVPAVSGVTVYPVAATDPQTLCVEQPISADVVLSLPFGPNPGARYRVARMPAASGSGVVRVRPRSAAPDGSGDVVGLAVAGAFADVEWDGASWRMTAQGTLDSTRLTLSGALGVSGTTTLQAATGVTLPPSDSSTGLATTGFVKAQGYVAAANNLTDLSSAAAARTSLGLGSLALQSAGSAAVTGGTIDGTVVGGTTPASGTFTTLSATKVTLLGGSGLSETGGYVNLSSGSGLAAQFYITPGTNGFLFSYANNTTVTLLPGQANASLIVRGNGTGSVSAPSGLAVSGGTFSASTVAIAGGVIDGVTLGTSSGVGAIKGVAKAQLFDASWEVAPFAAAGGAGVNDTLTLVNGSNAHLALWSPDKSMGWNIHIDFNNGNLRLVRTAGSGGVVLGNGAPVTVGGSLAVSGAASLCAPTSPLGFFGATGTTRPTVIGARGGSAALASLLSALAGLGLITDGTTP